MRWNVAADEAERETIKLKKVEYMQAHIGEEFDGVISGITNMGYVCRAFEYDRGLVHVTNMTDDHYEYNVERYEDDRNAYTESVQTGRRLKSTGAGCRSV